MNSASEQQAQLNLHEAAALGALERAKGHATATAAALAEAGHALDMACSERAREAGKVAELFRLAAVRLDVLLRRFAEGAP